MQFSFSNLERKEQIWQAARDNDIDRISQLLRTATLEDLLYEANVSNTYSIIIYYI